MRRRAILFVPQCGPRIGFGHLMRCLRVARALRSHYDVMFLTEGISEHVDLVHPFKPVQEIPRVDCVVTDLLKPRLLPSFEKIRRIRPCVSFHDMGIGQFPSDVAIDSSVVQLVPYPADRQNLHVGPRYAVLDPGRAAPAVGPPPRIYMNFGGGDVTAIYHTVLRALESIDGPLEIRACRGYMRWNGLTSRAHPIQWLGPEDSVAGELAGSWFALCAGGLALYEVARGGVPALVISHHHAQEKTAAEFQRLGAAISLGTKRTVSSDAIRSGVQTLLCAPATRSRMRQAGRKIVDGQGLARVTRIIASVVEDGP